MCISLFKRGFIQVNAGCQARGMTPWYWSIGRDNLGWFSLSAHVPNLAVWFAWDLNHRMR